MRNFLSSSPKNIGNAFLNWFAIQEEVNQLFEILRDKKIPVNVNCFHCLMFRKNAEKNILDSASLLEVGGEPPFFVFIFYICCLWQFSSVLDWGFCGYPKLFIQTYVRPCFEELLFCNQGNVISINDFYESGEMWIASYCGFDWRWDFYHVYLY